MHSHLASNTIPKSHQISATCEKLLFQIMADLLLTSVGTACSFRQEFGECWFWKVSWIEVGSLMSLFPSKCRWLLLGIVPWNNLFQDNNCHKIYVLSCSCSAFYWVLSLFLCHSFAKILFSVQDKQASLKAYEKDHKHDFHLWNYFLLETKQKTSLCPMPNWPWERNSAFFQLLPMCW